jgi:hypothetical protein
LDVRLDAAAFRSHMNGAEGEHSLPEIGEFEVHLVLVEDLGGIGDEGFDAGKPVVPTLRGGPPRQELDVWVICAGQIALAAIPIVLELAQNLDVLLRHRPSSISRRTEGAAFHAKRRCSSKAPTPNNRRRSGRVRSLGKPETHRIRNLRMNILEGGRPFLETSEGKDLQMAQQTKTKSRAGSRSRSNRRTSTNGRTAAKSRSSASRPQTARTPKRKASSSDQKGALDAAKDATTKGANAAGDVVTSAAKNLKTPLIATGTALAGVAAGLALTRKKNKGISGIHLPSRGTRRATTKGLGEAAKNIGMLAERTGKVAQQVRVASEAIGEDSAPPQVQVRHRGRPGGAYESPAVKG